MRKRAYFVSEDDETGVGVVATSAKEAKQLCWGTDYFNNDSWVDMRASWKKGINVDHLDIGIINNEVECLRLGIYGFVENGTCPKCKDDDCYLTLIEFDDGRPAEVMCEQCEDKELEKEIPA